MFSPKIAIIGIALAALVGGPWRLPVESAQADEVQATQFRQLLQQKLLILKKVAAQQTRLHEKGLVSLSVVTTANIAVLKAELELCNTSEERVAVAEKMLAEAKKLEQEIAALAKRAVVSDEEAQLAELYRLDVEIALEKAKEDVKTPTVAQALQVSGDYPRNEDAISVPEIGTSFGDKPLSPKELISRGSVLMNTNKDVAVMFVVRSVETVPTILADGSKLEVLHLVPNDDVAGNKFSAPINPRCLAQVKQIGIDDIAKHFVGRTVTLRGRVTGTALQLYASPDMWTYHIEVRSCDDVLSVTRETSDDEVR